MADAWEGEACLAGGGMNILHVVPSYLPAWRYGGTVKSVHGLCRALAARGHRVDVFTTSVDGPEDSRVPLETPVEIDGVRVFYFRSPALRRLYWSPRMGAALTARAGEYDVVHGHSVFLWPTWAASRAAARAGVAYVLSPRGMLERGLIREKSALAKRLWIRVIEARNLSRAAAVHATTEREAAEMRALGLRLPRMFVVPNGFDGDVSREPSVAAPGLEDALAGGPFIVYIGRLSWKKRLDVLIGALRHEPRGRIVIAGNDDEGQRPRLEILARELGVADRVRFLAPVYGKDKLRLLSSASALALVSASENFGNIVLEALAQGCPVVLSREVGLAPEVEAAGCGVAVKCCPEAVGAALGRMLSDSVARDKMVSKSRGFVARFAWDRVAVETERMYESILAEKRPA